MSFLLKASIPVANIISVSISLGVFSFIIYLIFKFKNCSAPNRIEQQEGVIFPGKPSAWFTIIGGLLLVAGGIFVSLSPELSWLSAMPTALGAFTAGFMTPSLSTLHDVIWNKGYIEGPSKLFGPTLGNERKRIKWSDIVSSGSTFTGYWFLEDCRGSRIYWSYLYKNRPKFNKAIRNHCPHIYSDNKVVM